MQKLYPLLFLFCLATPVQAQYSASRDAQYIATLKAVVNYKIDDEEISKDIQRLRENSHFLEKLQKKLDKLDNRRTKNSTNRKVMKILEKAGEDISKILN